jgi:hypothetical protein
MGVNPNTLSPSKPTYLSRRMQVRRGLTTIYKDICSFEEKVTLVKGTAVSRNYRSKLVVKTLAADGAYSRQAIVDTAETMTVGDPKEISLYVTDVDALQSNYATKNLYAEDAITTLDEYTDGQILSEAANAGSVVGAYEIAGTGSLADGLGFTLTTDNIMKMFSKVASKQKAKHVPMKDRWAVLSSEAYEVLWQFIAGRESMLGDKVGQNPNELGVYHNNRLFVTEGCYWTANLVVNSTASDGDTVVINGVTWTFETSTLDAAGKVKSETSAAVCIDNLVAAINNSESLAASTLGTAYYEVTAANRLLLDGLVAVDHTTYMTLKGYGVGYVTVSETLTDAASVWTPTQQIQHILFGQGKPIDLVLQKYPSMKMVPRTGYVGEDLVVWQLGAQKTFKEGADTMVDVLVRTDAY